MNGLLNVSSSQLLEKEQPAPLRYLEHAWNQICSTARGVAAIPTEVPRPLSVVYTTQIRQLSRRQAAKYFTETSGDFQVE